ncbi:hypothetical protein Pla175_05760 [Pirellulimonas nuda]|uniref:Uncharacterized protein n=1 Tax=Pirellulimonas nuda TaxID=2528009 RepID=A0A518D6Z8_9BACT|nr:hypothetical protein [Pirellulimonas nuda]QDU87219.1 hypothetical protein Pla175_05760 [Pirellulimonas nuda]
MDTPTPPIAVPPAIPITPEQRAALAAGDGYAEFFDPQSQTTYAVERVKPFQLTPEGERKLQEGIDAVDRGDVVEFDPEYFRGVIAAAAKRANGQ